MKKEISHRRSYKTYLLILFGMPSAAIIILALVNYFVDPFWLWHRKPLISRNDSSEYILEMQGRVIKPLQVIMRQPNTVLLGSSRVYHVLDPNDIEKSEQVYNMGISGLMVSEAVGYVKLLVHWTPVKHIYYGLDFFSFGFPSQRPGYSKDVENISYPFDSVFSSLIGKNATEDSLSILFHKYNSLVIISYKNKSFKDIGWHWNGYQLTAKRPPWLVLIGNESIKNGISNSYNGVNEKIFLQHINKLNEIIRLAKKHHVKLTLYFSPIGENMMNFYKQDGFWPLFLFWKKAIVQIAKNNQIEIWDFARPNFITDSPYQTEAQIKTNPFFLDSSHVSPLVGQYVLSCMGVRLKKPIHPPKDICYQAG